MYPRQIRQALHEVLEDLPVVLLNGARRTGKSTLLGVVFYNGEQVVHFDEQLVAVPLALFWAG